MSASYRVASCALRGSVSVLLMVLCCEMPAAGRPATPEPLVQSASLGDEMSVSFGVQIKLLLVACAVASGMSGLAAASQSNVTVPEADAGPTTCPRNSK